ncbi:hypothetical protein TOTORO_01650 [Serratia phage vB_SmaS-Totoro]|nr:hypothetical protein TOTORO_01650 [Serratia phage vB_SmaS-Totoro]
MGVWLDIYTCKKDELADHPLNAGGSYGLPLNVKKTPYLSIKGAYKLSLAIFSALGQGGDFNTAYAQILSKDSIKAIQMAVEVLLSKEQGEFAGELKILHGAVTKVLAEADFETETVLFDFS